MLQRERIARKLSIKDVAQETAISPRFIDALEKDDFTLFPGETYIIGFLNNYAEYLNIDSESLITLFRQQKVDASQTPVHELVKRNFFSQYLKFFPSRRAAYWFLLIAVCLTGGLGIVSSFDFRALERHWSHLKNPEAYCGGEREVRVSYLPLPASSPRSETLSTSPPDALRFSSDGLVLKFCLENVKAEGAGMPLGTFNVRIDEKWNYRFQVYERQTYTLSNTMKELRSLKHKIKFTPTILSDFSARIEVETEKIEAPKIKRTPPPPQQTAQVQKTQQQQPPQQTAHAQETAVPSESSQNNIQVTLEFIKESYVEWVRDGRFYRGRLIPMGEVRTFEAEDRLEIKLGNGGGVRISRAGVNPRLAGPASRIVKLEYRRIPDPLDPGISKITEFIKVVQ